MTRHAVWSGLLLLLLSVPSLGCSLTPGTFLRSNFELIDAADAIVVAEAVAHDDQQDGHAGRGRFQVIDILKGVAPAQLLQSRVQVKPTPSQLLS